MGISNFTEEASFLEAVRRLIESPIAIARMLECLGTAGREPYDVESRSQETRRRTAGLIEESIVLCKHLRVLLGDDPTVGYPIEELPEILISIGERFDCLWVVKWALQRSLPNGELDRETL